MVGPKRNKNERDWDEDDDYDNDVDYDEDVNYDEDDWDD